MQKKLLILLLLFLISVICTGCLFSEPNNDPIITSTPITTTSVGITYTYNVDATDYDEDILTYTLTTPPAGMTINPSSGLIIWTPTEEGDYPITVKVSDGKSTDTQSFIITVSLGVTTSKRVVMWELFVGPKCSRCAGVSSDIAQLRQEYDFDELVILEEYGWNSGYEGWAVVDVQKRYYKYLNYLGINGEFPDAYFNGLNQIVHMENRGYANYKAAIEAELSKPIQINISASYEAAGYIVNITGSVFNVSDSPLNNLIVEVMIYEDSVYSEFRKDYVDNVVRDIITYEESGELIDSFAPGGSHEFSLDSSSLSNVHDMSNIHVVVYVQAPNSPTKEILQALYVE
jgi:hypothetical protein